MLIKNIIIIALTSLFLILPYEFIDKHGFISVLSGWFSVLLLLIIANKKKNFLISYLTGIIFYLVSFRWIFECIRTYYISADSKVIYILFISFILYHALEFPIFALVYNKIKNSFLEKYCLVGCISFCSVDYLFYKIFPISISHSQASFFYFASIGSIFGIYTITFCMFFILELIIASVKYKKISYLGTSFFIFSLCIIYGIYKENLYENTNFETQKFIIIQKEDLMVEVEDKYNFYGNNFLKNIINNEKKLLSKNQNSPIFILPEVINNSALNQQNPKATEIENYFLPFPVIFGSYTVDNNENFYNSAVVINSDGKYIIYNKTTLLPFGEKIPFADILYKFNIRPYDDLELFAGNKESLLTINHNGKQISILPMICYEDIIPKKSVKIEAPNNPNVLISLSKDLWFLGKARLQHDLLASFRALETGKYMLRASSQGISSIISPTLKHVRKINENLTGYISFDVPLITNQTLYTKYKNIFWIILSFISVFCICYNLFKRSKINK